MLLRRVMGPHVCVRMYVHEPNLQPCDLHISLRGGINFHMFIQMLEIDACGRCWAILCPPAVKCAPCCRETLFTVKPVRVTRVGFVHVTLTGCISCRTGGFHSRKCTHCAPLHFPAGVWGGGGGGAQSGPKNQPVCVRYSLTGSLIGSRLVISRSNSKQTS